MQIPSRWDDEADLVVIGGGGAGLAAAVAAAAEGAKVVVFEKSRRLGGTTGIAVGSFTAAGTSFQKAIAIEDNPALHDEDMAKFAAWREVRNNPALRRWLAGHAAETLEWLSELGLRFNGPNPEPPNRVPRMHNVVPNAKAYIAALQRRAQQLGVRIFVGHRAEQLFRVAAGRVVGVAVSNGSGRSLRARARRGIVLAAGDYSSSEVLKTEYLPAGVAAVEGINPNSTGDGHLLARSVGAGLSNMDLVYGPEIRFVSPPRHPFVQLLPANPALARLFAWAMDLLPRKALDRIIQSLLVTWQHPEGSLLEKGAILVNSEGKRFCNELSQPELAIPKQPGKIAYYILDQQMAEVFSQWPYYVSTAPGIAYAYLRDYERLRPDVYARATSLAELGRRIGVDSAALEESLESYNQAAQGQTADAFGREHFGPPLRRPPFYALGPVKSWLVTTEGGVLVNECMQVLDSRGVLIPGLYACGSNGMGGIVIWGHGLHLAWAFTSGRAAGRNAVRAEMQQQNVSSAPSGRSSFSTQAVHYSRIKESEI
jgi:fumarate reductase flavoprotein subunit